ncbi:MAG TPA: S8/S53 family peptidase [Ktedonobacteraceae bacterium]|nr:S8/S53 family peptidase [Ktedonobacteraceae bacterium]
MSRNGVELMGIPDELCYWVPGEMVVIVQLPLRPADDALKLLEEQVRGQLNTVLAPYHMRLEAYGEAGRWLDVEMISMVLRRVFIFGLHGQQPLAAIFFHVHHADPNVGDPMPMALSYLQAHLEQLEQAGLRLLSTMPNWLITAAPVLYAGGGPALPPRPAPALDVATSGNPPVGWHISFLDQNLTFDPRGAEEVMIAVLDTAHHADRLRSAATRPEFRRNWLLQRLAANVRSENGSFEIEYDRYPILNEVRTGRDAYNDGRYYFMPDHGVFVSGLIRDIASRARIRLIRILNDFGGGDLYNLFAALTDLEQELVSGTIRRLVINLSLTIMPDIRRLPYVWFPNRVWTSAQLNGVMRALNHIEEGLRLLFHSLSRHGALIVAAAGNDSIRSNQKGLPPRPPRAPARYEDVLGVASVNSHFAPSLFSNAANIPSHDTGIATFGGDSGGAIDSNGLPDAIRGVYISPTFPGGQQNLTGWADWAGTSFSTAIISGLGAHFMAQGWSAANTIDRIAAGQERRAEKLFGTPLEAPRLLSNVVRVQQGFGM